jgi:hypothetical protein
MIPVEDLRRDRVTTYIISLQGVRWQTFKQRPEAGLREILSIARL